jgi:FtsZ-interacting cell division protein YlmF
MIVRLWWSAWLQRVQTVKRRRADHEDEESRAQEEERREKREESREQRAESREQRAESREQRAESREKSAESRAESRGGVCARRSMFVRLTHVGVRSCTSAEPESSTAPA